MSETFQPLFPVRETEDPRGGYTTAMMADKLREGAMDRDRLIAQVRNFAKAHYIHPFAILTTDERRPYLYRASQVFIAAVIKRLVDHGFKDKLVLNAVALELNTYNVDKWPDGPARLRSIPGREASNPADFLIDQCMTGIDGWALEIASFRHPDVDRSEVRVRLRNGFVKTGDGKWIGTEYLQPEGTTPRMMSILDLSSVLESLFGELRPKRTVN